jgi:hypothetical protein
MNAGAAALTVFCFGLATIFVVRFALVSKRQGRVHPVLWLAAALLGISWCESPFSYLTYAVYAPELPKIPQRGPYDMIHGGLPWLAPAGYVAYFLAGALIGCAVARRLTDRYGFGRVKALLVAGFCAGFVWDFVFENLGIQLGAFRYTRATPGFSVFSGTVHMFPVYISFAMATQHMLTTYLLGRVTDRGDMLIAAWARRRTGHKVLHPLVTVGVTFVVFQAFYLAIMSPHMVAKSLGYHTVVSNEPPYDNLTLPPK